MRERAPWVIVACGATRNSGTDRANLALVKYLLDEDVPVHVVAHDVDSELQEHENLRWTPVPRTGLEAVLGEHRLEVVGRRVAYAAKQANPATRVLVNGGNCLWPDLNWIHYVHHAWKTSLERAPYWFQAKELISSAVARRKERKAIRTARLLFANSDRTRNDVVELLGVSPEVVRTVHLGADPQWAPPTIQERNAVRHELNLADDDLVAVFVGGVGFDGRKGLDTLLASWRQLVRPGGWRVKLLIAGSGRALSECRARIERDGLSSQIRCLGHTDRVFSLLAGVDLLVSPSRYESYGLNVQEALCRGIPAIVTATAGVAERYPDDWRPMLLQDPNSVEELALLLRRWRDQASDWGSRAVCLSERIRSYTWNDMAKRMADLAMEAA